MIIGITGNSGTGKTAICKLLIQKLNNTYIIDADKIAKNMAVPKTEYFEEIIKEFGEEVLLSNGNLDRKKLADIIFSDNQKKDKLDLITSKYVVKKIKNEVEKNKNKLVLLDAPLLIETNLHKSCDVVISILADSKIKLNRICLRDNISIDVAKKRINSQPNNEFYIKNSDYVVINDDINLEEKVKDILHFLKEKMEVKNV